MWDEDSAFIPGNLISQAESVEDGPTSTRIYVKPDACFEKEIVLHSDVILCPKVETSFVFLFSSLTCSECSLHVLNMHIKCKFLVTDVSHFLAENCTFQAYRARDEAAIEVLHSSHAHFKNCKFINSDKCALMVRGSSIECENCSFTDIIQTAIAVIDNSQCFVHNCKFLGKCQRYALYLFNGSEATVADCSFKNIEGRAVFGLDHASITVATTRLENCKIGAVGCTNASCVVVRDSYFSRNSGNVCHAIKNSQLLCYRCFWSECPGNGLTYEFSTGFADSCLFQNMGASAFLCFGPRANPVFSNSSTKGMKWPSVTVRDCSTPFIFNCQFDGSQHGCCTVSDFSEPSFLKCRMECGQNLMAVVDNGSNASFCGCDFTECESCFKVFNLGEVSLNGNVFPDVENPFDVTFRGKVNFADTNWSMRNGESHEITLESDLSVKLGAVCDDLKDLIDDRAADFVFSTEEDEGDGNLACKMPCAFKPPFEVPEAPRSTDPSLSRPPLDLSGIPPPDDDSQRRLLPLPAVGQRHVHRGTVRVSITPDMNVDVNQSRKFPRRESHVEGSWKPRPGPGARRATIGPNGEERGPPGSDPGMRSAFGESLRPMSPFGSKVVRDKPCELCEIMEVPMMETSIDSAIEIIPEMIALKEYLEKSRHMDPPHKKKRLTAERILEQFQGKNFAPEGVIRCETCDREAVTVCCPCGHHVWCEACAKVSGAKEGAVCPKCNGRCLAVAKIFLEDTCAVCLSDVPDTVILPCGHKCICYGCATRFWNEKKRCPLCNQQMYSFRHDFPV